MNIPRIIILSALPLITTGRLFITAVPAGISLAVSSILVIQTPVKAEDASAIARTAKAITVKIEGATQGSGVIVKQEGNRYTVLTAWHVVSGNRPGEEVGIYTPDGKQHLLEQGSIQGCS